MGVEEEGSQEQAQQRPQQKAPWMSQSKKGRGMKKKGAKKARRHDEKTDGDGDGLCDETAARIPVAVAVAVGVKPAACRTFVPSAAREALLKRRGFLRRGGGGGGCSSSDLADKLRRLQCPFTWELEVLSGCSAELYGLLEETPYRPTAWHVAVQQLQFAFEFARHRLLWKSRELLEEVYSMLAALDRACGPAPGAGPGAGPGPTLQGDLLLKYRRGLKHVLDATWLLVREDRDAAEGRALPDGTLPNEVTSYDQLDDRQKASVWAMRSIMAQGNKPVGD